MKKFAALVLLLWTWLCPPLGQTKPVSPASPLVFTHVNVIDATGAPVKPDMTVVITGDRITTIGKAAAVRVPKGARVIDAHGKFLIPGLWDMHVHWYDEKTLPLFIANGVTGMRQMFGAKVHLKWRERQAKGELLVPRQYIGSPLVDGLNATWPGSIKVGTEEDARRAVRKIKEQGFDFVKVYSSLGHDAYLALADECRKQGITFAGHLPYQVTALEASNSGQKTFEHLNGFNNLTLECSSKESELRQERARLLQAISTETDRQKIATARQRFMRQVYETYDPQKAAILFAQLAKNQTWQCPTLTVNRSIAFLNDPNFRNDPRLKYLPRSIKASWQPENDFRFRSYTATEWELAQQSYRKGLSMVREMRRVGVQFLAGTDALNPYCLPGFSLHDELGLLVEAGLTPMEALQAATLNAAVFMNKRESLGTVEQGKLADLVLLDANPLDNIGNTKRIAAVVLNGRLFEKGELDAMLANAEKIASLKSVAELLRQIIDKQDAAAAVREYRALKVREPDSYDYSEDELIGLGYSLLEAKKIKEAIEIFKLNAEAYPESANAFDSLAEAYMANGDKELAIQNYKKSLELDPDNENAVDRLKKLGAP